MKMTKDQILAEFPVCDIWSDFNHYLKSFESGEGFASATTRLKCVHELLEIRDMLEAVGEDVMTESEVTSITGDF